MEKLVKESVSNLARRAIFTLMTSWAIIKMFMSWNLAKKRWKNLLFHFSCSQKMQNLVSKQFLTKSKKGKLELLLFTIVLYQTRLNMHLK
jgi:hypothetical protein